MAVQSKIHQALKDKKRLEFKNKLQKAREDSTVDKKVFYIKRKWLLAAAAAIALVIIWAIWKPDKPINIDKVFAEFFAPSETLFRGEGGNRGGGQNNAWLQKWDEVDSLYAAKNYPLALEKINGFSTDMATEYKSEYNFQKGILLLRNGKAEEAANVLKDVGMDLSEDAAWFRALAIFKWKGNDDLTKNELKKLINENNPHKKEAEKLLGILK